MTLITRRSGVQIPSPLIYVASATHKTPGVKVIETSHLKMIAGTIDDAEHLFVAAGGFNAKRGPKWTSPLHVMKRK